MSILARLDRLERKHNARDPYADVSDDELAAMIAALEQSIERETGMTTAAYAEHLRQCQIANMLPPNFDASVVRGFLASMRSEPVNAYLATKAGVPQ